MKKKERHCQSSSLTIQNDQRHHLDRGKRKEVGGERKKKMTIANILGRKGPCVCVCAWVYGWKKRKCAGVSEHEKGEERRGELKELSGAGCSERHGADWIYEYRAAEM